MCSEARRRLRPSSPGWCNAQHALSTPGEHALCAEGHTLRHTPTHPRTVYGLAHHLPIYVCVMYPQSRDKCLLSL